MSMNKWLKATVFVISCLSLAFAIGDMADRDVTVYVVVPQEIPLTVMAGHSFRDTAAEFCEKNGLPPQSVINLTQALEVKYEAMKLQSEALFKVAISLTFMNTSTNAQEQIQANLSLYEGDTVFNSVYRFCSTYGLDIYEHGKNLENIVLNSLAQLVRPDLANNTDSTGPLRLNTSKSNLQPVMLNTSRSAEEGTKMSENEDPLAEAVPIATQTTAETSVEADNVVAEVDPTEPSPDMNDTKFKLFSLPVKVDDKEVELEFYNGDHLNGKITEFLDRYGLDEETSRQPLIDAVLSYTEALQEKFPNALWFENL